MGPLLSHLCVQQRRPLDTWCERVCDFVGLRFLRMLRDGKTIGEHRGRPRTAQVQRWRGHSFVAEADTPPSPGTRATLENLSGVRPGRAAALLDVSVPAWKVLVCNSEWSEMMSAESVWRTGVHLRGGADRQSLQDSLSRRVVFTVNLIKRNGRDSVIIKLTYARSHELVPSAVSKVRDLYVAEVTFASTNRNNSLQATNIAMPPPPVPGLKLGPLVGMGSMGQVRRATLDDYGEVAVKFTQATLTGFSGEMEAELGRDLHHENVVRVLRTETVSNQYHRDTWQVMEYCARGSLKSQLAAALTEESDRWILHVAQGMEYVHSRSVIHGDLNSANVLVSADGTAKVSDLGISRMYGGVAMQTNSHGTVTHMPPELLFQRALSPATDVYSFGVLVWELCHRQVAWQGLSRGEILERKLHGKGLEWTAPPRWQKLFIDCMGQEVLARPTFSRICQYVTRTSLDSP